MKLHAAILEGPNGPFAILRAHPEDGEVPVTDEGRREIARCFKERHNNIPVAFLANEPAGLRLLGYEDATGDLEQCLRSVSVPDLSWKDFDADA
jgi:hypothetical protein